MRINQVTMAGVLAALVLIMAPGFVAQAAPPIDPGLAPIPGGAGAPPPAQTVGLDTSPDVAGTAGNIEAPDVEVADDVGEVEAPDIENIDVADVGDIETPDVEAPEIEVPEVEAPEVETPELGE
ncbi:MAG: hypothetical protein Q9M24_04270 [Mariprofundaceae bacterium]|nr:hypothetical protein [Mariprofundaceae bacterium]